MYYCGFAKVCLTAREVSHSKGRGASVGFRRVDSCDEARDLHQLTLASRPFNTGVKLRSSNMLGFVCFIPLFDGAVRNLTMVRTRRIMPRMTGRHAIAGRNLPTRAGRVRRLDFADRSAA